MEDVLHGTSGFYKTTGSKAADVAYTIADGDVYTIKETGKTILIRLICVIIGCIFSILLMLLYFFFVKVGEERAVVGETSYTGYEVVQINRGYKGI